MSQTITHRRDYAQARKAEYPDVGDQLDAIWAALAVSGLNLPAETNAMLARIGTVKTKFPKPGPGGGQGGKP